MTFSFKHEALAPPNFLLASLPPIVALQAGQATTSDTFDTNDIIRMSLERIFYSPTRIHISCQILR
jgi:hypothetical protein